MAAPAAKASVEPAARVSSALRVTWRWYGRRRPPATATGGPSPAREGAAEAAIAALKEGKSDVICEQGQLYKISKNKDGVVNRERLTKH